MYICIYVYMYICICMCMCICICMLGVPYNIYIYIYMLPPPPWLSTLFGLFPQTVLALKGSYVQSKGIGYGPQRRTRGWGATFVSTLPLWFRANSLAFRRSRCGFARLPLRFDAPAVVSREFRLPLACSGLFGGPLRLRAATAHTVGRDLRFDAPAVVSREFPRVSTLPLWFRANSLAFRRSRCGFARIPSRFDAPAVVAREFPCISTLPLWFRAHSGLFWPALASSGGPLRLRAATAHAVGRDLRFDAPAVVSREFPCVSTLPPWFRATSLAFRRSRCGFARIPASSGLLWPLLEGRLGCGPQRRTRWGATLHSRCGFARIIPCMRFDAPSVSAPAVVPCVSTLPLWFRATSLAFRRSRCGFARLPLTFGPTRSLCLSLKSWRSGRQGIRLF